MSAKTTCGRSPRLAMRAPQAPNRTADLRLSAVSLAIRSPVSTAPAETVLQRSVAPSHWRCGAAVALSQGP